jgi:hypothetical protein
MTVPLLSAAAFPSFQRSVRAQWAPVMIEPIVGSFERLVIGVAAVSAEGFHLEMANALDRLECLYGNDAGSLIYAITLTEEHLRHDIARRLLGALREPKPIISGTSIGPCREGEGESLASIACSWLSSLSSLYRPTSGRAADLLAQPANDFEEAREAAFRNVLPLQVMDYVIGRRERFAGYFHSDIREGKKRRFAGRSHEVHIDFAGSRLVANFEALVPARISASVTTIKRRLWDLKVERDRAPEITKGRLHEMLVHSPDRSDPLFTAKQHETIQEALYALEKQADQEELRLRPLSAVSDIGDRILQAEAA